MQIEELQRHLTVLSEETAACTKCALHKQRLKPVFSRGNSNALMAICGMNPGNEENESGIPFVGRSGKLLDKALQSLGLDPANDVYILNAVKCHSLNNAPPTSSEIESCHPYLERHLDLLPAKVVITLGNLATRVITDQVKGITQIRGQFFKVKDKHVCPTYHPSAILRSGGENADAYEEFKSDIQLAFQKAKELS